MSLKGNVLIGQSGGPTSVINSSLHSIITEAKKYGFISDIYGAIHGIEGVLNKQLIDLRLETDETIEGLTRTPGAALGGCRHKVQESDLETIICPYRIAGKDSLVPAVCKVFPNHGCASFY
jgi:6-phosphofructokinase